MRVPVAGSATEAVADLTLAMPLFVAAMALVVPVAATAAGSANEQVLPAAAVQVHAANLDDPAAVVADNCDPADMHCSSLDHHCRHIDPIVPSRSPSLGHNLVGGIRDWD
jgi:hypothetical protein